MGRMNVSLCRCMCVSSVHPMTVFNAAFCMTCNLLMLVEDARGDHMEETLLRWSHDCFIGSVSFCLPHPVAVSAFIICSGLRGCTEMV